MSAMTREQIKTEAMKLDPVARESLAEELPLSIDAQEREQIDRAWLAELDRRERLLAEGKSTARPAHEIIDQLMRKGQQ